MRTRQLMSGAGKTLGAVALIDDITDQLHADAQQEQIERARFWRELAGAVSHENPQPARGHQDVSPSSCPQRYTDERFRLEFREMVTREVGRLDGIVSQIEGFCTPRQAGCGRPGGPLPSLLQEAASGQCARADRGRWTRRSRSPRTEDLPDLERRCQAR